MPETPAEARTPAQSAAVRLFDALLDAAPATVAGFVRPVLPPEGLPPGGSGETLGDRVGETTAEGGAILPRLRETPGDRLLPDRPGRPADLLKAGLLLLHGDLDGAHELAQRHEGNRDADAWHALVHRLEGDFGNSAYWWRRAGAHPAFDPLAEEARLGAAYDPQLFTERYREAVRGTDAAERAEVRAIQAAEFALLLRYGVERG